MASDLGIELLDTPQMSVRKSLFTITDGIPAHYLRNFYRDAYELVRSYMPEDKIVKGITALCQTIRENLR